MTEVVEVVVSGSMSNAHDNSETVPQRQSNDSLSKMFRVICSSSVSPLFRRASNMRRTSKSGPSASFHIKRALYACMNGRSASTFLNASSLTSAENWAINDSNTGLQSVPSPRETSRRILLVRKMSVCTISTSNNSKISQVRIHSRSLIQSAYQLRKKSTKQ